MRVEERKAMKILSSFSNDKYYCNLGGSCVVIDWYAAVYLTCEQQFTQQCRALHNPNVTVTKHLTKGIKLFDRLKDICPQLKETAAPFLTAEALTVFEKNSSF